MTSHDEDAHPLTPRLQVQAALQHAEPIFRSFSAVDWRAMANECEARAAAQTCIDCGRDVNLLAVEALPLAKRHRLRDGLWSCAGAVPWDGLCSAGKHGLDFDGQPCDLCAAASEGPA